MPPSVGDGVAYALPAVLVWCLARSAKVVLFWARRADARNFPAKPWLNPRRYSRLESLLDTALRMRPTILFDTVGSGGHSVGTASLPSASQ